MKPLYRTRNGICSRGWLFLGENGGPCDQRCAFCYYAFQKDLVFFDLQTLQGHANCLRHYYGLDACDITGGEPTVYPRIAALVDYCAKIGLAPTIITHGQRLAEPWQGNPENGTVAAALESLGLDDWLVSVHGGSPESHDKMLDREGSFDRMLAGLAECKRPVRVNTTLTTHNLHDLPHRTVLPLLQPTVWNIINFNPFHAWSTKKDIDFQVSYKEAGPIVGDAVAEAEAAGWEVNVRYWPLCHAEPYGFAENVCGFHQVAYDPWEWRLSTTRRRPRNEEGLTPEAVEARESDSTLWGRGNHLCLRCAYRKICDMLPEQYAKAHGIDECKPITGDPIQDPLHFQRGRGATPEAGPA